MIPQSLFTKWPKNYQTKIKKQYNNNILLNIMLSAKNITIPFLKKLFQFASSPSLFTHQFSKKILVNAFFEPSTRTSLSFETAMYKLGGNVITFQKDTSSLKKGESFGDTIHTLSTYGDVMILRHPNKDMIEEAEKYSSIPIINAGNGNGEHPTQALLDLFTIHKHLKSIEFPHHITYLDEWTDGFPVKRLRVLFIGDILNSRTIHSLIDLLIKFTNITIQFLPYYGCEPTYGMKAKIFHHCDQKEPIVVDNDTIKIYDYDIIYSTRLQSERSEKGEKPHIIINKSFMSQMKKEAIVMHPLPRNEEIDPEVDDDPRCMYFKQMENGVHIRMSLLANLFYHQDIPSEKSPNDRSPIPYEDVELI